MRGLILRATTGTKSKFLALMAFVSLLASAGAGFAADEPARVSIVPFTINAEKDMAFLRDGIYDMLSSRLSWEGKVLVLGRTVSEKAFGALKSPIQPAAARDIGAGIGADWVLFGSLTVFGSAVSIDAKMVDVAGERDTLSFFNQSEGMEEVIPRINLIAQEINSRVFGRMAAAAGPATTPSPAAPAQQGQPSIYAHPESLVDQGERNYSPFVMEGGAYSESPGFWKSRNIKSEIRSMSLGDVNGDGKIETVLASSLEVFVFQNDGGRFEKLAEVAGSPRREVLGVDTADINGNGTEEIFVTAVNARAATGTMYNALESFVLEWNGSAYVPIAEDLGWYLRVITHPARGKLLLGQARAIQSLFFGPVQELAWAGGRLEPTGNTIAARGLTVFGIAQGDVTNEGADSVVGLDGGDRLRIYSAGGKRMWQSEDLFGGSETFIKSAPDAGSRTYLPQRVFVGDLNDNGKNEVLVVRNESLSGRILDNFRRYGGGQVLSLSWNGLGLAKNWHTRKVSGYFSDFAVGDVDNDGQTEIAVCVVRDRKNPLDAGRSAIVVYDLESLSAGAGAVE